MVKERNPNSAKNSGSKTLSRMVFLSAVSALLTLIIVIKLISIQVFSSHYYSSLQRKQTEKMLINQGLRGEILDRNGKKLAYNLEKQFSLSSLYGSSDAKFSHLKLGQEDAGAFNRKRKRVYPYGHLAGQVLGFVGTDGYGLAGIEYSLDDVLRGKPGWKVIGRDGKRRAYPFQKSPGEKPVPGYNVSLTIDIDLQAVVEKALQKGVEKSKAIQGMALVMDPSTGEILAMASCPAFNPNLIGKYKSREWKNLPISYTYEPGSTFKIVTAGAAIENKVKRENDLIDGSQGIFIVYGEEIHDHVPYGFLTFRKALAYSSNVCFAKIAEEVGSGDLYQFSRAFGFGSRTGIPLPGEEPGVLHPLSSWSGRTRATMSIGHEVSGSLLQSACAFATIGNGGVLLKPRIVKEITCANEKWQKTFSPVVVRRVLSEESAGKLCDFLVDVVEYGTGSSARIPGIHIAGKTGTAQKVDMEKKTYLDDQYMASFIGFLPAYNPQLLCAVTLDDPKVGTSGGKSAAPIFRQIVKLALHAPELPYAQYVEKSSSSPTNDPVYFQVPDFAGIGTRSAMALAKANGISISLVGGGEVVTSQFPRKYCVVPYTHEMVLFTDEGKAYEDSSTRYIPSVIGKSPREALQKLNYLGVELKMVGTGKIVYQSLSPGTEIYPGMKCVLKGEDKG